MSKLWGHLLHLCPLQGAIPIRILCPQNKNSKMIQFHVIVLSQSSGDHNISSPSLISVRIAATGIAQF